MKRIPVFLRNLSVSWKFILAYYLVLIIPMAFFGVYFYMKSSDDSISQAKMVMEQNLLQTRASILQKVKLIENITQIITTNDSVQSVFYYEYERENDRLRDFQFDISPMLENVHSQNNLIYSIRIYTPRTIFTEMIGSYYSVRKEDSPGKFNEIAGSIHTAGGWASAHGSIGNILRMGSDEPEQVFSYSGSILPPVSVSGASIGTVEIEVKENLLFDMLRVPVISKWGQVFVVNSEGRIVSNNIPDLYFKNVSDLGLTDFDNSKAINKLEELNGRQSILITTPVEDIGCSVVGIFPAENFNSDAKASIVNLLIVLSVLSVLLGFIIYFLTNALLRRVKILVKAMKQVKENNLDVSVPVNAEDEFGELALNFNHMTGRIHELVETVYKIQLLERDAQLKALEAQINPHFLYNTLATISWVGRRGSQEEVVRISNSLARFYRLVLSKGGSTIAVKDEIDMVKAYLQIQKIRFGDMFDVEYRLNDDVMSCMIMKNLLQPLVENALNHGIEPKRAHGTLIIGVERRDGDLVLQVVDDGVGMDGRTLSDVAAGKVERSGGGYAIKNVIERLQAYYDKGHSFEVFSRPGIGAQFTITIKAGGF
ncbi:MAG TPA: histidine kinase [Clostridia bacterium]|nr:histidine kinase [Clostridia bacterium]